MSVYGGDPMLVAFAAGDTGPWRIDSIRPVKGDGLPNSLRLKVLEGGEALHAAGAAWVLKGSTSNTRYTHFNEAKSLLSRQQTLNRPNATRAALIPICKNRDWWSLAQDERRALFEEQSHHIAIGLEYLPGIARRLHHGRELGQQFDFLTWFEYDPQDSEAFETLVYRLRQTPEWGFVDRELDIRLSRDE
jgi:hypothetical protein